MASNLPFLLIGPLTGGAIAFEWPMVRIVATAPFVEEWFFRGVLVLAFVRLAGVSFWPTAIVSGVLFGAVHVNPWTGARLKRLPVRAIKSTKLLAFQLGGVSALYGEILAAGQVAARGGG